MFNDFLSGAGLDGFPRSNSLPVPLYAFYEAAHAVLGPARLASGAARQMLQHPINPWASTQWARSAAAACELFERATRRYGKPSFDLDATVIGGDLVEVEEKVVWERPFCRLLHFAKGREGAGRSGPKILLVAPLSGHYATLLRGTVEAFLPDHEVYITDWADARMVPLAAGRFDLDDYIDYVIAMLQTIGEGAHVIGVCQPSVPVMAAVARMEAQNNPFSPKTMILMGGPIDTRCSPTKVNEMAMQKGLDWFAENVIVKVPFPHPGFLRDVYPGFLQIMGFMTMNLDRHVDAHKKLYHDLVRGDGDGAQKHREFYDEYLAVMDLPAEFYLQTVDTVFIKHALPKGEMTHRGQPVDPTLIRKAALLTVEGEHDDITGHGQTHAAQDLCVNIPSQRKARYTQAGVGHYGVFNGSKFRKEIAPRIAEFIRTHEKGEAPRSRSAKLRENGKAARDKLSPARPARAKSRTASRRPRRQG